jgi:hypothetical protein
MSALSSSARDLHPPLLLLLLLLLTLIRKT